MQLLTPVEALSRVRYPIAWLCLWTYAARNSSIEILKGVLRSESKHNVKVSIDSIRT